MQPKLPKTRSVHSRYALAFNVLNMNFNEYSFFSYDEHLLAPGILPVLPIRLLANPLVHSM